MGIRFRIEIFFILLFLLIPNGTVSGKDEKHGKFPKRSESYFSNSANSKDITKGTIYGIHNMVLVEGGCFEMGDTFDEGDPDEKPVHTVCVNDFYLSDHEVTKGEFREFVNETGHIPESERRGGCQVSKEGKEQPEKGTSWEKLPLEMVQSEDHPVVCVSWNDAAAFIDWLKIKYQEEYRLPTEAEWEYSARSGKKGYRYSWGNGHPLGKKGGNIADDSFKKGWNEKAVIWDGYNDGYVATSPVKRFTANEFGLYDMTGNVWEWVQDLYGGDYYKNSARDNPKGPQAGTMRVLRGSSWLYEPNFLRTSNRSAMQPDSRNYNIGFRVAKTPTSLNPKSNK